MILRHFQLVYSKSTIQPSHSFSKLSYLLEIDKYRESSSTVFLLPTFLIWESASCTLREDKYKDWDTQILTIINRFTRRVFHQQSQVPMETLGLIKLYPRQEQSCQQYPQNQIFAKISAILKANHSGL